MRALIQRVTHGRCTVAGKVTGQIAGGLVVLLGVGPQDTAAEATKLAQKIARLRIFGDDAGKMNLSVHDLGGEVLSISQFTLYADTRSGNRPGFSRAAPPVLAEQLYHTFNAALRSEGLTVAEGIFGADMQIDLCNDGPVTIMLDTDEWAQARG
ncbi:D-aminoacyl-tRNA deacylase [Deinococcus radiophilus]|uniref:D-aminoacyl-tRNA deacylase n=1 Tax=Deinococcus radiophilus TaxID=32062 RepID=A0A3S0IA00_9DEIO|nr:D-aminoacyl-tRNA deacylase [Deinococcus radiophilus]RTR30881.1 D-tyrosyl-tRNA(Tyr) deacylase [Deinococcus radiophilus]UFA49462.1 D-tyrosyl-tRNA(Tyr) deacylase [Deinococcus radiophilus]